MGHALDYLGMRYPEAVEAAAAELDAGDERRVRDRLAGDGFARSESLATGVGDRPVGRTRLAGADRGDDPTGGVLARDATDEEEGPDDERGRSDSDDDGDRSEETPGEDGSAGAPETRTVATQRLGEVVADSAFDDLTVLSDGRRGRLSDAYRAAATVGGERRAVTLQIYRLPEDRESFVGGLAAALGAWADVDDHPGVRTVHDWGRRPRPWAALSYAEGTLTEGGSDPADPLGTAVEVAEAVAHAHRGGVVHGAIDPAAVAYPDTGIEAIPLLTGLGVATETGYDDPGVGVDPRYAAPEHVDDDRGAVDGATDVYGLGLLVYGLCTGRHPPTDDAGLRDFERDLTPTDRDPALPGALDSVVGKATATEKIRRYETVTRLASDLRAVGDGS